MAKQTEHAKIIHTAAKTFLAPLGCRRVGQSRLWVSDERSWVIVVEFQPSGFSRGSYLNVAPMWLWREAGKGEWSFDYGPVRIARYVEFQSTEQFTAEADAFAQRAADEVRTLRESLGTPLAITRGLAEAVEGGSLWQWYHAAVAAGLTGDSGSSLKLFTQAILYRDHHAANWVPNLQNRCADLAAKLSEPCQFRKAIDGIVQRTRANLNLPNDPTCLESWRLDITHGVRSD
jgi:hypothetical protein